MKHIILSTILTVVAKWLLPVWVAVALVLLIGIIKGVYDKVSGDGCDEWEEYQKKQEEQYEVLE